MLKKISAHIKDLYFIKQILHGVTGGVVARDLNDTYIQVQLDALNIQKYNAASLVIGRTVYESCNKKVACYYKVCGENAINSNKVFISKKVYSPLGQEYEGLLYFYPYKDQQNNIIGCVSYNIDIVYLKNTANFLFNKSNINLKKLYYNLVGYKELFCEIITIINKINLKYIINDNNIVLIQHLKNHLNILLNNLNSICQMLINNNFSA